MTGNEKNELPEFAIDYDRKRIRSTSFTSFKKKIQNCPSLKKISTFRLESSILETVILQKHANIHESNKNQTVDSNPEISIVPKLKLEEHVSENAHIHNLGNENLSEEGVKLKNKIDDIIFNELFVKQHLDELENELEKLKRNDPKNPLLIQGNR